MVRLTCASDVGHVQSTKHIFLMNPYISSGDNFLFTLTNIPSPVFLQKFSKPCPAIQPGAKLLRTWCLSVCTSMCVSTEVVCVRCLGCGNCKQLGYTSACALQRKPRNRSAQSTQPHTPIKIACRSLQKQIHRACVYLQYLHTHTHYLIVIYRRWNSN